MTPKLSDVDSTEKISSQRDPNEDSVLIFDRYDGPISESKLKVIKTFLDKYILGVVISKYTGEILYNFQVDPKIRVNNMDHFIAALSIFGEENVGRIKRIIIDGLNIEMSIVHQNGLVLTTFFRPNMLKNYVETAAKGLDLFYAKFKDSIEANILDQSIYQSFDAEIFKIIMSTVPSWEPSSKPPPEIDLNTKKLFS